MQVKFKLNVVDPTACKRCGSPLTGIQDPEQPLNNRPAGFCSDQTCPYSDHLQNEEFTEG
jgi:hypothetical protein